MDAGAFYLGGDRCQFTVWAPLHKQVAVNIVSPKARLLPMQEAGFGYWQLTADAIAPGTQYFYQLDDQLERPDPASQFQPDGVHGPSQVVDQAAFSWTDNNWSGIPLDELIIYELHTGTFTPEGTFEAIIPRLPDLKALGVNAIELMPIAQFPGSRNWGYDGTYPFAVQNSYGGPEGLKRLVNACHQQGMAIVLDVVYNHFGPEGSYFSDYGPYFTEKYKGVWGGALNFDGAQSHAIRNYFLQNALYWFETYHFDMLRLDATDHIVDLTAKHFLQELAERVAELSQQKGRKFYLAAENDVNDVRILRSIEQGGYGMDAQWNDGFHHCAHTLLTGEQIGYYQDYGRCEQLAKAMKQGFVYSWEYSPFRDRWHGSDSSALPGQQFVVCIQNHDQIGNRMLGDRLTHLVSFDALKLGAAVLLLSPNVPLLFMGEEYGEDAPFLYFVSHTDPNLVEAVRAGRKREFAHFHLEGEYIDPQSEEAFQRSQLRWEMRQEGKHKLLHDLYQQLIQLRRTVPALKKLDKQNLEATTLEDEKLLLLHRWSAESQIFCLMNFNQEPVSCTPKIPTANWKKILDSADETWAGTGAKLPNELVFGQSLIIPASSFALYQT
ncbi:malto-oligosyltrehalose trehalohydrolase [Stenomitos frigidus]|uniref:Malto-oligosyltrehalose trehalohydrolase n=1 Tax=Stenomitos frigidus ULC18 TaxID=2107698 RepID=A0A2T1DT72_9CYAN|nr:malto-oligosyltrehalose trehalohydrolase [Stenomitos frigidus]PSB23697.1 malto-oligosyltrehalose trehalohydrolase [Stenomitos frigidus ULC18]